jgi:hypothetical protein
VGDRLCTWPPVVKAMRASNWGAVYLRMQYPLIGSNWQLRWRRSHTDRSVHTQQPRASAARACSIQRVYLVFSLCGDFHRQALTNRATRHPMVADSARGWARRRRRCRSWVRHARAPPRRAAGREHVAGLRVSVVTDEGCFAPSRGVRHGSRSGSRGWRRAMSARAGRRLSFRASRGPACLREVAGEGPVPSGACRSCARPAILVTHHWLPHPSRPAPISRHCGV